MRPSSATRLGRAGRSNCVLIVYVENFRRARADANKLNRGKTIEIAHAAPANPRRHSSMHYLVTAVFAFPQ
jgi:hypothetical protein